MRRKNLVSVLLAVVLICFLMPIHHSEAADWKQIYADDAEAYYVDVSSVRKDKKQHYYYWFKTAYVGEDARQHEISSIKSVFPTVDFSNLSYEVTKEEAYTDDSGSYYRDSLTYYYDKDGNAFYVWNMSNSLFYGWQSLVPESLGMEIYNQAKSYAKKK